MTAMEDKSKTLPPAEPLRLFGLLRHGQTVWNVEKRLQGHGDSPLTEAGRRRTLRWARHLAGCGWETIVASDLGRVRETVEILNSVLDLPLEFDSRLREQHWGDWEGLRFTDVERRFPGELQQQIRAGWDFRAPGGESRREVRERVFAALDDIDRRSRHRRILVVCHQGVIKSFIYTAAGRRYLPGEPPLLENDRLHTLGRDGHGYRLVELNIATTGTESPDSRKSSARP